MIEGTLYYLLSHAPASNFISGPQIKYKALTMQKMWPVPELYS